MKVSLTADDLIAFEDEIAALFADKKVRAPVHLAGGNEKPLIEIFEKHVDEQDWVLGSWRSHYHCLLKGVPPERVKEEIVAGRSISLCFPDYRILSSGIVGGTAPIAVGLAMAIKRKGETGKRKVVCFVGDMTYETGIVQEAVRYARGHALPVLWVIEDNGLSVGTPTQEAWGARAPIWSDTTLYYRYHLTRPHVGIGNFVSF